jgi:predicted transcriptional regulator
MTANEMVKELVDKLKHSKYSVAKQSGLSETIVRQLYTGERGRYVRIETVEKVRELYVRLTGKTVDDQKPYLFNNMEEFLAASAKLAKPEIEASYRKGILVGTKTERARCLKLWETSVDASVIVEQIKKGKRRSK